MVFLPGRDGSLVVESPFQWSESCLGVERVLNGFLDDLRSSRVCVHMCIRMCVCRVHTYTCTYVHMCMCVCMHVCVCAHMMLRVYMYVKYSAARGYSALTIDIVLF